MSSEVSQPSNQDCQPTGSCSQQKVKLCVNKYNQIVGEGSNKFKSKLGKLVRTHIPITYHDWRVVPDAYKEDVWNDAMTRYSIPPCYKNECYKRMGSMLRTWRTKLRRRYFSKYKTNAERLAHVPCFVKRDQ